MQEIRSLSEDLDYMAVLDYGKESVKYLGKPWISDNKGIYRVLMNDAYGAQSTVYLELCCSI